MLLKVKDKRLSESSVICVALVEKSGKQNCESLEMASKVSTGSQLAKVIAFIGSYILPTKFYNYWTRWCIKL